MSEVDFSKITALAVEDDTGGIALIGMILRRLGMNAHIDTTGNHTVQMALSMKPRPDIIFMDLTLQRRSGFDVLQELRAQPLLKMVRVVAVSSMDPHEALPRCQQAGFDGFIPKPIRIKQFVNQVRLILEGQDIWEAYTAANVNVD